MQKERCQPYVQSSVESYQRKEHLFFHANDTHSALVYVRDAVNEVDDDEDSKWKYDAKDIEAPQLVFQSLFRGGSYDVNLFYQEVVDQDLRRHIASQTKQDRRLT